MLKILVLSASNIGRKTRLATEAFYDILQETAPDHQLTYLNLQDKNIDMSDGRHYLDYKGDTLALTSTIMESDIIVIGSPIFQASIPGNLKNVFDLLPQDALLNKTVSLIITAGSEKHFLVPEQQLKPILSYMKANILSSYVFLIDTDFGIDGIESDDIYLRLQKLAGDTLLLGQTYSQMLQAQENSYGF